MSKFYVVLGCSTSERAAKGKVTRVKNVAGVSMHVARYVNDRYVTVAGPFNTEEEAEKVNSKMWEHYFCSVVLTDLYVKEDNA